jgi:hypothetical protein
VNTLLEALEDALLEAFGSSVLRLSDLQDRLLEFGSLAGVREKIESTPPEDLEVVLLGLLREHRSVFR